MVWSIIFELSEVEEISEKGLRCIWHWNSGLKKKKRKKIQHFQNVIMKQGWIPDESHHVMNTQMRLAQIIMFTIMHLS